MCGRKAQRLLSAGFTVGLSELYPAVTGANNGEPYNLFDPINPPDMPAPPDPLKPAGPPEKTAQDLWSPEGQKDAQALAARLGTNALIVPFQTMNVP